MATYSPKDFNVLNKQFAQFLTQMGVSDADQVKLLDFNGTLAGYTPPPSLLRAYQTGDFADQASSEVSPYYDKSLAIALKQLDLAKSQHKELVDIAAKQQKQAEEQYGKSADMTFAQVLRGAQQGFSGRGTFNSGFRNFNVKQDINAQQLDNQNQAIAFANSTQNRDVGFKQFLDTNALDQEATTLDITRQKNEAILANERALQQEALARQGNARDVISGGFDSFKNILQTLAA